MDELNILKEEMAAMKRNLDKQQIVNENLMRTVMRQRSSWLNTLVKAEIIMLPFLYLIIAGACAFFKMSQWYAFVFLILAVIDTALDWRTLRISPKIFSSCSMMEVRKLLIKQKKERFIQTCISSPLAIIWLVFFSMAIMNSNNMAMNQGVGEAVNLGGAIGGIIGGILGLIVIVILYRKAQKTNDTIIDEIDEE